MVDSTVLESSPFDRLGARVLTAEGITAEAMATTPKLSIRGNASDEFCQSVADALGLALPLIPNTVSRDPQREEAGALFWMGPDEWLWRDDRGDADLRQITTRLTRALQQRQQHSAVVDVSDYYAVLRLTGDKVFDVLAKGTPLDCVSALSDETQCAQTRLGHANVLLDRIRSDDNALCVNVQVRWSLVESIWHLLQLGMREFTPTSLP